MINRYFESQFPVDIGWSNVGNHTVMIENRISSFKFGTDEHLVSVILGKDLSVLETNCFKDCTNLTSVEFIRPDVDSDGTNLTEIQANAFQGCSNLKSISFNRNEVKDAIGNNAFKGSGLTSLILKTGTIGNNAFESTGLTQVSVAANAIGDSAFANNSDMQMLILSASGNIGQNAFLNIDLAGNTSYVSARTIDEGAFKNSTKNKDVNATIHVHAEVISANAFRDSSYLSIDLQGVKSLRLGSFNGGTTTTGTKQCANGLYYHGELYSDKTDDLLKNFVSNGIFENCSSLTSITLPNTLTEIVCTPGSSSSDAITITIDYNRTGFNKTINGKTYNIKGEWLRQSPMFRNCTSLREIHIDSTNLTSISEAAFSFIQDPNVQEGTGNTLSIYFDDLTRDQATLKFPNIDMVCMFAINTIDLKYNNPDCIVIFKNGLFDPNVNTMHATKICLANAGWTNIGSVKIMNNGSPEFADTVGIEDDYIES